MGSDVRVRVRAVRVALHMRAKHSYHSCFNMIPARARVRYRLLTLAIFFLFTRFLNF